MEEVTIVFLTHCSRVEKDVLLYFDSSFPKVLWLRDCLLVKKKKTIYVLWITPLITKNNYWNVLSRLSVTTQPLDVVYNPLVLDHISEFFSRASMEGTQALHIERQLREVARVRYEALKNQTRAELVQTLDAMMEGSEMVNKLK